MRKNRTSKKAAGMKGGGTTVRTTMTSPFGRGMKKSGKRGGGRAR